MTEVYDDISELEGCEQSSPKKLFECTSRYYDAMVKRLKAYFPLDQKNADYAALAELREAMTPPATTRKWSESISQWGYEDTSFIEFLHFLGAIKKSF